jgi:hypothetical protein
VANVLVPCPALGHSFPTVAGGTPRPPTRSCSKSCCGGSALARSAARQSISGTAAGTLPNVIR